MHPLRVALILTEELGLADTDLVATALLHDVVEASPGSDPQPLRDRFGPTVADAVLALTKPPRGARSRSQVNRTYFARVKDASPVARIVKLADKLDNVRDAINCPDPAKRARTAAEARELFSLLCPTLADRGAAAELIRLLEASVERLERLR